MTSGRRRHDPIRTMLVYDVVVIVFLDPCLVSANASFQDLTVDPVRNARA
jgi:hypothetical protein